MMISKTQIQQVMKQYGDNTKAPKPEKRGDISAARQADQVILSQKALTAQQVQKYIKETPDVREEKVLALQQKIQSGTYNISGEDIAEKIIGRTIVDRML